MYKQNLDRFILNDLLNVRVHIFTNLKHFITQFLNYIPQGDMLHNGPKTILLSFFYHNKIIMMNN
jgi:hypothetical protein